MSEIKMKSSGKVKPKKGINTRLPYEHQKDAFKCLDIINRNDSYSTLVVLPTGGGKTYTASMWLLKNALDKRKKILWIAHRQMLLDQAGESFQKYAYAETIPHISEFTYRIISGSTAHGKTREIQPNDNLLIVGKDALGRNIERIDQWLKGEKEIFFVIDEAHHSTAKTYRKVIDHIKKKVPNVKLIGLTATPFRTAIEEKGLLAKIFTDGVENGICKKDDIGITYQIGLKELINRQILSKPIFESYFTEENFGESMGLNDWEHIQQLDVLPEDIAVEMAKNATRNRLIVDTYKDNTSVYGKTLIFAVSILHAITLTALFRKAGIKADYVISDIKDAATGIKISREDNEKRIEEYRSGELQVLINVNILTEGVDLPQTQSVFLARPTVSTILMTQMIGRALRGTAAGGTSTAYIVSFIDNWNDHIAWVNPESLFTGENDFTELKTERRDSNLRMIAVSKIEEFAAMLDDSINTSALESVPFVQRIPVGMYAFSYLEENGMDLSYQVMVYDSTLGAYKQLMEALPALFDDFGVDDEFPNIKILNKMEERCRETFFCGEMIPPYEVKDIIRVLKYYAQYDVAPTFYTFDEIDRNHLDISTIAQHIYSEDMGPRRRQEYINELWDSTDDNVLRIFFGRKLYFTKQLDLELNKITDPGLWDDESNVEYGTKKLVDLPLYEIGKHNQILEKKLRDTAFEKAMLKTGEYVCAHCGKKATNRILFQVDHIIPMDKGGKSVPENLQILCRHCNGLKGDSL